MIPNWLMNITQAIMEWHGSIPDWLALLVGFGVAVTLCYVSVLFLGWLENWHRTVARKPLSYRLTFKDWIGIALIIAATIACVLIFIVTFVPLAIASLFVRDPLPKGDGHWDDRTAVLNKTLP